MKFRLEFRKTFELLSGRRENIAWVSLHVKYFIKIATVLCKKYARKFHNIKLFLPDKYGAIKRKN